jgi:hypothetical protein
MKKKLSDYEQSESNLLIGDVYKRISVVPNYKNAEKIREGLLLPLANSVIVRDNEEFVKWYGTSYSKIGDLSNSGVRVLSYILIMLPKDKDWLCIDMEECMQHCGYTSVQAVRNGVLDLLENKYIQRKSGGSNRFFINPNYFFKGHRDRIPELATIMNSMKESVKKNSKPKAWEI